MLNELIIATKNKHKIDEIRNLLSEMPIKVISLSDICGCEDPAENGETFEANALIKARYYAECTKKAVIADDSGLEVDALDGRPGVLSARYAGDHPTSEKLCKKILKELEGIPEEKRTARFVCVAAIVFPNGKEEICRGEVEGKITDKIRGDKGFGYDAIFMPDGWSKTFAESSQEEKNKVSHRGKALGKIKDILEGQP